VPAPRLFVVFAAEAPVGVVIRRGPSSWTQLVLWRTDRDTFEEGAWLRGRIYAEKCDLSPDGELFVYAAFQGGRLRTKTTDSYTAVSRPPWLHALALWPMGTTYGGGGRFVGKRRLALRGAGQALEDHPADGLEIASERAERHRSTEEVEGAEWSGRDGRNRLVYAKDGKLLARSGLGDVELADFNGRVPEPREAPAWAKAPITRSPRRGR
jgi:hypothetical protein